MYYLTICDYFPSWLEYLAIINNYLSILHPKWAIWLFSILYGLFDYFPSCMDYLAIFHPVLTILLFSIRCGLFGYFPSVQVPAPSPWFLGNSRPRSLSRPGNRLPHSHYPLRHLLHHQLAFLYHARESSLVPAGFLTAQFLQKL